MDWAEECGKCSFKSRKGCPFLLTTGWKKTKPNGEEETKIEQVCAILLLARRLPILEDKVVKNQAAIESTRNEIFNSIRALGQFVAQQLEETTKCQLPLKSPHTKKLP